MNNTSDMAHITLLDYGAYWVRFYRGTNSKGRKQSFEAQKSFSFEKYGGWVRALKAAKKFRDDHLATREPKKSVRAKFYKRHSNNTTGAVGVQKLAGERYKGRDGYTAAWRETHNGERLVRSKNFTFRITGNDQENFDLKQKAFRDAARYRKRMEKTHYIEAF